MATVRAPKHLAAGAGRRGATALRTRPCSATGFSSAPPPLTPHPPQRCLHSASASSRSPRQPRSPPSTSKSSAAGSPAATASRASPSPPPTPSSSSRSRRLAPPGRAWTTGFLTLCALPVVAGMPVPRGGRGGFRDHGRVPWNLGERGRLLARPSSARRFPAILRGNCFCAQLVTTGACLAL
jgi:hypothetical protein